MTKVAVLTSGGVDSSLALLKLKNSDHQVEAFYLKIWLDKELSYLGQCPWKDDLKVVSEICKKFDIKLNVVEFQHVYWQKVVSYFIEELRNGHTPNPDVMCNSYVKFGEFIDEIDEDYDFVATGHYAGLEEINGFHYLKMCPDKVKDQTYFLCNLSQSQLKRSIFPINDMKKSEVREMAKSYGLNNSGRPDSQGICFLGKVDYNEFVKHHLGEIKGYFIEVETGKKLGEHNGHWFFTNGQRKGIHLNNGPWYVCYKDKDSNSVFVSKNFKSNFMKFRDLDLNPINNNQLYAKFRHGPNIHEVSFDNDVLTSKKFDYFAPGQFVSIYQQHKDNFYLIGKCIIE